MGVIKLLSVLIADKPGRTELLVARNQLVKPGPKPWEVWTARENGSGGVVRMRSGQLNDLDALFVNRQNDPLRLSGSVSLDDLGVTMEDIAADMAARREAEYASAATSKSKLVKIPEPRLTQRVAQKVRQQLTQAGSPAPPLEVPAERVARATLAMSYYHKDGIAGPAIRSLYEFVIGPGFDVDPVYTWDELPSWFNVNAPEVGIARQRYIAALPDVEKSSTDPDTGETTTTKSRPKTIGKKSNERDRLIFMEYLRQRGEELRDRLELESYAVELARDGLAAGDGFGWRVDNLVDEKAIEDLQPAQEYLFNTVFEIQGINPLGIELETDEFGTLVGAKIRPAGDFSGQGDSIPQAELGKLIHLKWNSNRYTTYGVSQLENALTELQLKESLMFAMKVSADRYSLPIKMLKYGVMAPGSDGGPIAPVAWRDEAIQAMGNFNPQRDVLVAPFHWVLEYIGADQALLDLAGDIEASNRRIMMAIGVPPNFLDSNYTSYNTAKIQVANMFLRLRDLQLKTGAVIERGILDPWAQMRGYRDPAGNVIKFRVNWRKANLEGDPEMLSTIRTLAAVPTQEVMSVRTQRNLMGLNPDIEEQNFAAERASRRQRMEEEGLDPNTGLPPGVGPDGKPIDTQPGTDNTDQNDESQQEDKSTAARLDAVEEFVRAAGTDWKLEDRIKAQLDVQIEELKAYARQVATAGKTRGTTRGRGQKDG